MLDIAKKSTSVVPTPNMYYYMTGFVTNFTVSIVSDAFLFHRTNNLLINLIEFILFSLEQEFLWMK